MSPLPSLLLSLLAPAPRTDPASLLSSDATVYSRIRHPSLSRLVAASSARQSEGQGGADAFYEALEIAAGWELGIPPAEMASLRDRIVLHQAILVTPGNATYEQTFELVVEGFPAGRLPVRDRPRGFFGETAYAVHGDLVLAASDLSRVEKMLRRAQEEERSPSLADDRGLLRAREAAAPDGEFHYSPMTNWKHLMTSQIRSGGGFEPAQQERFARTVGRVIDLLGGVLVTLVEDPTRPGAKRTDIRFLLDPSHPLFPVYEALRQEGGDPRLLDRLPADSGTAGGFRVDVAKLLGNLRAWKPTEGAAEDDPANGMARAFADFASSVPAGPEVDGRLAWLSSTFGGEVALFTKRAIHALVTGRADRRDFGFALSLSSPEAFDSIPENLPRFGIPVEAVEEDLFTARVPDLPPVFFARDGDAVVGGFHHSAIGRMRQARASGATLSADPLLRDVLPAGRPRSKWLYARLESFQRILRLFAPGLAAAETRADRLAGAFETLEEPGALHIWLGFSPVSFFELMSTEGALPEQVAAQIERLRVPEEKALASLLALREAEEEFRARRIHDRDGDGLAEYGTLTDLAAASLLPKGLSLDRATGEAEASGYLFRADLPPATNLAERLWAGYAWPQEYGETGVNAFWIRPQGPPRRRVDASYAGKGKGPRPDTAFLPPALPGMTPAEEHLWTAVGK